MKTKDYSWRYSKEILTFEDGILLDELFGDYYLYETTDIETIDKHKLKAIYIVDFNEKYQNTKSFFGGYVLTIDNKAYYVFGPYVSIEQIEEVIQKKLKLKKERTTLKSISYYIHKLSEDASKIFNLAVFFANSDKQKLEKYLKSIPDERVILKLINNTRGFTETIEENKDKFHLELSIFYIISMLRLLKDLSEELNEIMPYFYNENIKIFSVFDKVDLERIHLALVYLAFKGYKIYKRYNRDAIYTILEDLALKVSEFIERGKASQILKEKVDSIVYQKLKELIKNLSSIVEEKQKKNIDISLNEVLIEVKMLLSKLLKMEINQEIEIEYKLQKDEIKELMEIIEKERIEDIYKEETEYIVPKFDKFAEEEDEEEFGKEEYLRFKREYIDYTISDEELKKLSIFVNKIEKVNIYPITKMLYSKILKAKQYFTTKANFLQYLALKERNYRKYEKVPLEKIISEIFDTFKLVDFKAEVNKIAVLDNKFFIEFRNIEFVRRYDKKIDAPYIREGTIKFYKLNDDTYYAFEISDDKRKIGITTIPKTSEYISVVNIQDESKGTLIVNTIEKDKHEYRMAFSNLTIVVESKKDFVINISNYSNAYIDNSLVAIIKI